MDILQATMDKMRLGFKKRHTTFFLVFCIVFPVALIVTFKFRNSSFTFFEGFSENKVLEGETAQNGGSNVTTRGSVQNKTHENSGGTANNNNNNMSEVLQGKIQNGKDPIEGRTTAKDSTASEIGSKNASLTRSTNDSSAISIPDDKDKLLDGLLGSGFDETTCISWLQSHLYRKPSPHKPSPVLHI